jgi:hypothetical protein
VKTQAVWRTFKAEIRTWSNTECLSKIRWQSNNECVQ